MFYQKLFTTSKEEIHKVLHVVVATRRILLLRLNFSQNSFLLTVSERYLNIMKQLKKQEYEKLTRRSHLLFMYSIIISKNACIMYVF